MGIVIGWLVETSSLVMDTTVWMVTVTSCYLHRAWSVLAIDLRALQFRTPLHWVISSNQPNLWKRNMMWDLGKGRNLVFVLKDENSNLCMASNHMTFSKVTQSLLIPLWHGKHDSSLVSWMNGCSNPPSLSRWMPRAEGTCLPPRFPRTLVIFPR